MEKLVEDFCTPLLTGITDSDCKIISDAERIEIEFEGRILDAYSWGKGKTVVLSHGWSSRASHMAFLGRYLAAQGFRVIAYDSPAHSSFRTEGIKDKSNMFEFCRALSTVVKNFDSVYAIIGHSLGAAATAFTLAGFKRLSEFKIAAEKIVLISSPLDVNSIIKNYCEHHEKGISIFEELKTELQNEFDFSADEYSVSKAIKEIKADILMVHDEYDEVFPVKEAIEIQGANPRITIFTTSGAGHYKILLNRSMLVRVKNFLNGI